jgi:rubrerythrin
MDIYTFALQMEKDGENYYRELATKSGNEGLKKIFTMLADEEVKHFRLIETMREKSHLPEVVDAQVLISSTQQKKPMPTEKPATLKSKANNFIWKRRPKALTNRPEPTWKKSPPKSRNIII